jgi:general secretion pathway protein K
MKISPRKKFRDGIALIIAMVAIVVLSILAAALAYSMKVETQLAATVNSDQQLVWLARSGAELARWELAQEAAIPGQPYDALNQFWAGGSGSLAESNSVLSGVNLSDYQIGDGHVSIKIIDLERYANINSADTPELQQALTLMGVDADSISTISDSIQDWIDADDAPRIAGAEDDYYQSLPQPYHCKNAPIDDMKELLLIKGIWNQPEIFWGGVASNHPPSAFQHKLGLGNTPGQPADYPFGLKDLFTPFSNGRININTADPNVLQMIPGIDANIAQTIIQVRSGPDGADGTEDDTPFQSVNQLAMAGVDPQIASQLSRYCGVRSATFLVTITAKIADQSRDYTAILFRNGRTVTINSFYWDTEDKPPAPPPIPPAGSQ